MVEKFVDLRSDTVTKPSPAMRQAMACADVGDDVYGEDPCVNALQSKAAAILGKEAALFLPTGTMANLLAIKAHTSPGDEVIIEEWSHSYNYEVAGASALTGVQFRTIKGRRGILSSDQVEEAIRPIGPYTQTTRLICLENTHNRGGGSVYPLETMADICGVARRNGLSLHLDGARLFNACVASGVAPKEYAALSDTVSFCISKGLGAPVGSIIAGSKEMIKKIHRLRRMFGGGMRQAGILAAAGLYALNHNVDRLADDHRNAKLLAHGLSSIGGINIDEGAVETNIVVFDVSGSGLNSNQAIEALRKAGVLVSSFGKTAMRAVTHLDVSTSDIEIAGEAFRKVFK